MSRFVFWLSCHKLAQENKMRLLSLSAKSARTHLDLPPNLSCCHQIFLLTGLQGGRGWMVNMETHGNEERWGRAHTLCLLTERLKITQLHGTRAEPTEKSPTHRTGQGCTNAFIHRIKKNKQTRFLFEQINPESTQPNICFRNSRCAETLHLWVSSAAPVHQNQQQIKPHNTKQNKNPNQRSHAETNQVQTQRWFVSTSCCSPSKYSFNRSD